MPFLLLLLLISPQILGATAQDALKGFTWVLKAQAPKDVVGQCPVGCKGVYLSSVEDKELIVDHISLDNPQSEWQLKGGFLSAVNGILFSGSNINIKKNSLEAQDITFVIQAARWRGQSDSLIVHKDEKKSVIKNAEYTYCEPDSNVWSIAVQELVVIPEKNRVEARHAQFKLFGLPVLYLPYFSSSIQKERSTGFLLPKMSYSSDRGGIVSMPIFFNLANNYDMTLTPTYINQHGKGVSIETRYQGEHQQIFWQYDTFFTQKRRFQHKLLYNYDVVDGWGGTD